MEIEKIIDGLEMLDFFNQRAGRKLWQLKSKEVQDMDIEDAYRILREAIQTIKESNPVVHARWEISSDGYYPYCKKCNARPENGKMTKYCPHCGTKLCRGE